MSIHWGLDYNHRMRTISFYRWGSWTGLESRAIIGMGIKRSWLLRLFIYKTENCARSNVFNLSFFLSSKWKLLPPETWHGAQTIRWASVLHRLNLREVERPQWGHPLIAFPSFLQRPLGKTGWSLPNLTFVLWKDRLPGFFQRAGPGAFQALTYHDSLPSPQSLGIHIIINPFYTCRNWGTKSLINIIQDLRLLIHLLP